MLGNFQRTLSKRDSEAKKIIRRSIVLKKDLKIGEKINLENVKFVDLQGVSQKFIS